MAKQALVKVALFLLASTALSGPLLAEKPAIDFNAFDNWPSVRSLHLSSDGEYALFEVSRGRRHVNQVNTLVMRSVKGDWMMETKLSGDAQITRDGLRAVFIKPTNTLCVVTLGTSVEECVTSVDSFELVKHGMYEWLVYQAADASSALVVRNLTTGWRRSFADATNHWFSSDGHTLILQTAPDTNHGATLHSLQSVSLPDGAVTTFWRGSKASSVVFDDGNNQLAFIVENGGAASDQTDNSLWYFQLGDDRARVLVDNHSPGIDENLRIDAVIKGFSKDGNRIFISLREKDFPTANDGAVKVDVWSYKDPRLQSEQLAELTTFPPGHVNKGGPRSYVAVVPIREAYVIRLEREHEQLSLTALTTDDIGLIINESKGNLHEGNWNRAASETCSLISTKDGNRKEIVADDSCSLSPEGRYVVFTDKWRRNLLSYEVANGAFHNLTRHLPIPLIQKAYDENALPAPRGISLARWMDHDAAVLISDRYDIWRLDPAGKVRPQNVTNGYGRRQNVKFEFLENDELCPDGRCARDQEEIILKAFNRRTKDSGFYSQMLGSKNDPELRTMGPYTYELAYRSRPSEDLPRGANTNVYGVLRASATEAPNYFSTDDFRRFTQLSAVYPERAYNWLTTALLPFTVSRGRTELGVLYKPANFDPMRKYPVIIHFYESKSDELNEYQRPMAMADELPIPWFVSRGYLVFTPDIHYTIGHPGRSAYESVVSAAQRLAAFPWVDSKKMGLQGHSWGGFETNYIVTHTNIFSAAMSSSGFSDLVSDYDSLMPAAERESMQWFCETDQNRIGPTLWQRPELYLENSPILRANKVTTPILLMNNKDDGIVPFAQGVEFFVALRRLGKKAWMLQYDGQPHSLLDEAAKRQHTIRVTQFFDHYLKGVPAPLWMTEGIPARLKGVETGLELDTTGTVP